MEELINLFVNNGAAIACLIYFMWYNQNVSKEMTNAINALNVTVAKLSEKLGGDD